MILDRLPRFLWFLFILIVSQIDLYFDLFFVILSFTAVCHIDDRSNFDFVENVDYILI